MDNKVAIVILNWNGKHFLERFLPTLLLHTPHTLARIYIADNGSCDDSIDFLKQDYPALPCILLDQNYGFTGGYNRALKQIEAEYFVLLNSDVAVTKGWLSPLIEALDAHPERGICMPKIRSWSQPSMFEYAGASGGYIDRYGFPFCRGRILSRLEADHGQYDSPAQVFWASGTCLMIRSSLYRQLGGLDDRFFAHMEEIDLCWRAQRLGYQIWAIPQSLILHVGGGTLPNNSPQKLFLNYRNNLFMLHKNLPQKRKKFLLALRLLLDDLSCLLYLLQGKFSFAGAVRRAHVAYRKERSRITDTTLPQSTQLPFGMYPRSIILLFFLSLKKLRFSQLRWK